MNRLALLLPLLLIFTSCSDDGYSPEEVRALIGISQVIKFTPGSGQNFGQDSAYYPQNIYGMPDSSATLNWPCNKYTEVLSLGMDGEIIVSFGDNVIIDGEGPDFIVFENCFLSPVSQKIFCEPAIVSVSMDGENFVEFPYDFATLQGCAGFSPTLGPVNYAKPLASGGDHFDLADIGLSEIKYIKIKDICSRLLADKDHIYYDSIITGFDLDAIVAINYNTMQND